MAVQIRCPYCKEVLYIKEEEFDIETKCSRCQRAFIWSNVLERERWRKENLKRWQESHQKEEIRRLEEARKSGEVQAPEYKPEPGGGAAPVRFRLSLVGALGLVMAAVAVAAVVALALHRKSETGKREQDSRLSPAFSVPAEELCRAYKENEIKADSEYKGKVLAVSGKVTDIGRSPDGEACVCLAGSDRESSIQCFFPKSEENVLERLSKGDTIHVVGECKGIKSCNVLLHNCRGIEKPPPVH